MDHPSNDGVSIESCAWYSDRGTFPVKIEGYNMSCAAKEPQTEKPFFAILLRNISQGFSG
jgi:hypothetical protein